MRSVTYSMGVSLDGYIVGPDGKFDWTPPDEEVFRFVTDQIREVGVHLLGRRLYETMLYWETADQDPSLDDSMLEWAAIWKALPKVVFSTTLSAVQGNARRRPGGGDRAVASRAGAGQHRDRRRDSRRRGSRVGSDRRVSAQGLPGSGWRWHSVLSPARASGGSRTPRDPHVQLESRLPPLSRGAPPLGRAIKRPEQILFGASSCRPPTRATQREGGSPREVAPILARVLRRQLHGA